MQTFLGNTTTFPAPRYETHRKVFCEFWLVWVLITYLVFGNCKLRFVTLKHSFPVLSISITGEVVVAELQFYFLFEERFRALHKMKPKSSWTRLWTVLIDISPNNWLLRCFICLAEKLEHFSTSRDAETFQAPGTTHEQQLNIQQCPRGTTENWGTLSVKRWQVPCPLCPFSAWVVMYLKNSVWYNVLSHIF